MANKPEFPIKDFPGCEKGKNLGELTSIGIGGPADMYCALTDTDKLPTLIQKAQKLKMPYIVFGRGSNLIFADEGFKGLVIHIKANKIEVNNDEIIASAGALVSQIINKASENNLSGLEKLTGLPGTIGGAIRGNAGAYGTEIKDCLVEAEIFHPQKGVFKAKAKDLEFGYRNSALKNTLKGAIVLKVVLKLKKIDEATAKSMKEEIVEILKSRTGKQPKGKTTGSFFKNPDPDLSAGYLLDHVGAKGLQVGKAQVSQEHANWIINKGGAKQKDIVELAKILIEKVKTHFDIELEPEVQLISKDGFMDIQAG